MKNGFTLAEVLITLGVIGVVAALTMPTLIQNQQKKSLEVATKKFYSMMSQAVRQYMVDEGVDDLRNTPLASDNYADGISSPEAIASIRNFVMKYLKVVEECNDNCFAPKYKAWNGQETMLDYSEHAHSDSETRNYILADGSVIRIGYRQPINLYVDVNGKKGPNRVGYDLWSMSIFYDGFIDESEVKPECRKNNDCFLSISPQEVREVMFGDRCQEGQYGGCFGHFLNNNFKFDY